jgi:hypothetical protein
MMRTGNAVAIASLVVAMSVAALAQSALKVDRVSFSAPAAITEIDTDKLKGQPARLAWSPDGAQLYLQMLDGNFGQAGAAVRHYAFSTENGRKQDLKAEPDWASTYWTLKSAQASPDGPPMKVDLKSETRTASAAAAPMGGDLARGGSSVNPGASAGDVVAAAYSRQPIPVHSMFVRGELVGEFVNSVIVPGLTFGWGPAGTKVIAYVANKSGRVVVMDDLGTKKDVAGSKDAVLPAWSPDATRLAWLQKDGRKIFVLQVARVSGQ